MKTYHLVLTLAEIATLAKLSTRKHDCGLFDALEQIDMTPKGEIIFEIPPNAARTVKALSESPETGFAYLRWNFPLGMKIHHFLVSVH